MIKNFFQYKQLLFFFCLMTGMAGHCNSSTMMRDVIMILDQETGMIDREFDAMFMHLHAALHQKAAPIIVSASVWNRFDWIIELFRVNSQRDGTLEHQYMAVYNLLQKNIDNVVQRNPKYPKKEIRDKHYSETAVSTEWIGLVTEGVKLAQKKEREEIVKEIDSYANIRRNCSRF